MSKQTVKRKRVKKTEIQTVPIEAAEGSSNGKYIALFIALSLFLIISTLSLTRTFGPHAEKIANFELCLLGRFPLFLFLASCFFATLWLLFKKVIKSPKESIISYGHYSLGFMLLYVFVSVILAIMMPDTLKEVPLNFEKAFSEYSGFTGLFLVKRAFPPIFGQDTLGLLICSYLGVLMTAFCFGLRPKHIIEFIKIIKIGIQTVLYNMDFSKKAPRVTTGIRLQDTGEFKIVRLGEVKPAKGSPFGKPEKQTPVSPDPFKPQPATLFNSAEAQIEEQLAHATDPLEIRHLRDELARYKRVKDMNNWEDIKPTEFKIEGILSKEKPTTDNEQPIIKLAEENNSQFSILNSQFKETEAGEGLENHIYEDYIIPTIPEILGPIPDQTVDYTEDELQKLGFEIVKNLDNFKVKGKVAGIMTGPVITRFEIEPGPGVKVSRFENLADDLALTLKSASVRVITSIPGKSAVGIELPNRKPQTVYCKEILESPKFIKDPKKLNVVLGKDIMGDAFVTDLTRTPHLLIAGQTGAGKSVCINVLLASLLFSKTPDEVRLILVDPKVVELAMYKDIPHLLHPVITSPEVAVQALKWLCVEMDRRYNVLAAARVRNIEGFNNKFKNGELGDEVPEEEHKLMPFIVVIIDELADLMMTAGKEIETSIARIAQKARAVGIHLVLATQRPSVNVITGVIKANLPSRISFKVASYIDSKTILDGIGAEKLLGRGDMLFRSNDNPEPVRIHGAFLKDSEVEALANACSNQNVHYDRIETFDLEEEGTEDSFITPQNRDSLFWEAARIGLEAGELSISTLQRRLSIGFARAGKIMDQLTSEGICSKHNGSKPRKMLMNEEMIDNLEKR